MAGALALAAVAAALWAGARLSVRWLAILPLGAGVALSGLRIDLALSRLDASFGSYSQTNSLIVSLGYGFK